MKKTLAILISFAFLAALGTTVSAETVTDSTGDVWHWNYTGSTWGWEYNSVGKSNIDITELGYTVNGQQVTLTLKVAGTITNSDVVYYWAYLNTSDSHYWFNWANGEGSAMAMNTAEGSFQMDTDPEISVNGNTITVVYTVVGTFSAGTELWGWAAEYTTYGDTTNEWWADWVPNEESPYYDQYSSDSGDDNGDDNTDSGDSGSTDAGGSDGDDTGTNIPQPPSTPGFEFIALIASFAIFLIILRKRR